MKFEVTFEQLNDSMQQKIVFSTTDQTILWKGASSKNLQTRILTQKNPKATSKMLEKMLKEAGAEDNELVNNIIYHDERLIRTEKLFWDLHKSANSKVRKWVAVATKDSNLLKEMMDNEEDENIIFIIFCNKNYIHEKKQMLGKYEKCGNVICSKITKFETDSEILSELLDFEVKNYRRTNVIIQILNNSHFNSESKSINSLARCLNYDYKIEVAEKIINADIIKAILEAECKENDEPDSEVILALLENENCILTEETRNLLIKTVDWDVREKIAEECNNSDFLRVQLDYELKNEKDEDVIQAILENKKFILTKNIMEKIYLHSKELMRIYMAECIEDKSFLIYMLKCQVYNLKEKCVIEKILENPNLKLEEDEIIEFSICKFEIVREYIARLTYTPTYILTNMYLNENDENVIKRLLMNPNLRKEFEKDISLFKKRKIVSILKENDVKKPKEVLNSLLEVIYK